MKKLPSTLPNMVLSLGIVTAIAGALLGAVYEWTADPIARQQAEAQVSAIRNVAPPFDNDPEADKWQTEIAGNEFTVYPAMKGGTLAGAAVEATSMNGFSGRITVMCGFDSDGTVRDYRVLQQAETPGLGAKMEAWFRDPAGARSILGKNPRTTPFYVTKDTGHKGAVDGITAATISSRAFLDCMRDAYEAYRRYAEAKGLPAVTPLDGASDAATGASHRHGGATEGKQPAGCDGNHKEDAHTGATTHNRQTTDQ